MKRLALFLSVVLFLSASAQAKEKKIRGYVTKVISSTQFEIEDYRITKDTTLVLEFEKSEDEAPGDFTDIRVGTGLEIRGEYDEKTGELRAKSIKVILEENKKIKRTALLEQAPAISRAAEGWEGTFFADGQRIQVVSTTQVLFRLNKGEQKADKEKQKGQKNKTASEKAEEDLSFTAPLESIDQIGPDTFMTYEGIRQPDDTILASKVVFTRNELDNWEAGIRKSYLPKVKDPNYTQFKPGELKVSKMKFKLVPSQEAQQYIQRLGWSLVPQYQKNMAANNPDKIDFKFYLIVDKEPNAFALPNGVVVVHSGMFNVLENEAQLAAVLGHEISHAIQEHSRLQREYHRKKLMAMKIGAAVGSVWGGRAVMDIANMIEAAVRNGYSRSLENQADRTSLGYMLNAGYDIREAPRIWKLMAQKYGNQPTNFFYSNHDNHATRRSYLMSEMRMNYPDADYSSLRTNEEEYRRIQQMVQDATSKKKKK